MSAPSGTLVGRLYTVAQADKATVNSVAAAVRVNVLKRDTDTCPSVLIPLCTLSREERLLRISGAEEPTGVDVADNSQYGHAERNDDRATLVGKGILKDAITFNR